MNALPVYSTLMNAAFQWPDKPAIHDEYGTMSFLQLLDEVNTLKEQLIRAGIQPGMGVGVMAKNGRNFIAAIFAVVACGATVMPLSHQLKKNEIEAVLNEAELHAIVDDYSGLNPTNNPIHVIDVNIGKMRLAFSNHPFIKVFAPHVNAPAFIRFTSGTTGKAKGVVISHESAIERVEAANKILNLGSNDTVIWVLPIAYHFVVSILLYVRFGAAIAIARDFLAKNIIEITNQYKGTLLYASPMQIRLLANDGGTEKMNSLNRVISTSAPITAETCQLFEQRYQLKVSQAYGIIEIGLPLINHQITEDNVDSVGFVLPDYDVQILDENNAFLPKGAIGKLGIKGPGMFDAYLSPPLKRSEVLVNGYFITADFAMVLDDGSVKIHGREKSMINVSGNKVFPEEVEGVLETYPGIKLAKVSAIPHRLMGQIIKADIVLSNSVKEIDQEEVLTYCRKRLSTYKIPQKIDIVSAVEMTATGKIQR
jgi:acyl-coenzyme A synthetase/AMP-(fatty) acid ligase